MTLSTEAKQEPVRLPVPSDLAVASYEEAAKLAATNRYPILLCSRQLEAVVKAICDHRLAARTVCPIICFVPDEILKSPSCWALGGDTVIVVEDRLE
jgi:hypothetical protein